MRISTLSATFSLLAASAFGCSSSPTQGPPQASSGTASGASTGASTGASAGASAGAASGSGSMSTGSASGASGASAGSGSSSGHPADGGCDLTLLLSDPAAACAINDTYGVFVSLPAADGGAGAGAATGTQASPLHSIDAAITLAKMQSTMAIKKRVYVCIGYYDETIRVDATRDGVQLYGGLDCTNNWAFLGTRTGLKPSVPGTTATLTLTGLTSAHFEDFDVKPPLQPATAPTAPGAAGASSVAVFVENSKGIVMTNVLAAANNGQPGQDQMPLTTAAAEPTGHAGTAAAPGAQTTNSSCMTSIGGAGGAFGQDGSDGAPGTMNKGTKTGTCTGGNGSPGMGGGQGKGAAALGTLDATGWTPGNGLPGVAGTLGQGGGGGASKDAAAGGGGGGPGGCGGAGGAAGTGGGSSIGLLVHNSTVTLNNPTLQAGDAGQGGKGADGQVGQAGGAAGTAMGMACAGGPGGAGGSGGGGGGGAGGISAGIVWGGTTTINISDNADGSGAQPLMPGSIASLNAVQGVANGTAAGGMPGAGGASPGTGANGGTAGTAGITGVAVASLQVP